MYSYNLKKIFKNIELPKLDKNIIEEFKCFGKCFYSKTLDNVEFLILETEKELTNNEIEQIKQIVLNHKSYKHFQNEKIKELKRLGSEAIEKVAPIFKQCNASLGIYDATKTKIIKDAIITNKALIDNAEAEILALTSIEAVEAYNINIF